MKVVLGSGSARKIKITEDVLQELFGDVKIEVMGYTVASGVPETPYDRETFDGAKNRALACRERETADFYVGLESGLVERYGHIYEEAWTVIIAADGKEYYGYSSGLKVPDFILKRMDELKLPHYKVMGMVEEEFGKLPDDTWGTYTGGAIARTVSLQEALRNAFIQIAASDKSFYNK